MKWNKEKAIKTIWFLRNYGWCYQKVLYFASSAANISIWTFYHGACIKPLIKLSILKNLFKNERWVLLNVILKLKIHFLIKIQEYTSRFLKAPGYISSLVILRFLNLSSILNYQFIIFCHYFYNFNITPSLKLGYNSSSWRQIWRK